MKRIPSYSFLILVALFLSVQAFAQDDKTKKDAQAAAAEAAKMLSDTPETVVAPPKPVYWTNTLLTNLNFIQNSFTSWAAGGFNNYSLSTLIKGNANWAKDKMYWNNGLQLNYGFIYSQDKPILQNNADRLWLESTWGYKATNTLSYTVKFTYLSQLTSGWTYATPSVLEGEEPTVKQWKDARILRSDFLSPADVTLGVGADWIPNKWLTVNFSPLTGSVKVVKNDRLRKNYGMARKEKYEDTAQYPDEKDEAGKYFITGKYYKPARFSLGAQMTADVKFKINTNFDVASKLILFSNYLHNPQNFRVNWDNTILWKLNKFFSLNVITNLIYDDTVLILDEDFPNGHKAVQLKEYLNFGFTYTFSNKK